MEASARLVGQVDVSRKFIDIIEAKVPLEVMERVRRRRLETDLTSNPPDEKSLAKLHKQVEFSFILIQD